MTADDPKSLEKRIAETAQRLEEARARIPKHTPPAALMAEIDELEEELEHLRAQARPKSLEERLAEAEERLEEARSRIPKHTPPAALMVEIDELEEEVEDLRSQLDAK
jgi:polyhydroxyalkanoate synthesis regulator phasin